MMAEVPSFTVNQCRAAVLCPRLFFFSCRGGSTVLWDPAEVPTMGTTFHEAMDGLFLTLRCHERATGEVPGGASLRGLAYDRVLAPLLERRHGALADTGEALMGLWQSLQSGVDLVERLLAAGRACVPAGQLVERTLLQGEHAVEAAGRRTGRASLSGRIDAIVFDHERQVPVILEYKTGARSWRDADVVQVALYRWMLRQGRGIEAEPMLCYFSPALETVRFGGVDLARAPFADPLALLDDMTAWMAWQDGEAPLPPPRAPGLCRRCPNAGPCGELFGTEGTDS